MTVHRFSPISMYMLLIAIFIPISSSAEPLTLTAVAYQTVPENLVVDGVIEAVNGATLSAQTSGQVLEVNFDVEDFVKRGEILVKLNDEEQRANLVQTNAQLNEAKAYLSGSQSEYNRIKTAYERKAVPAAEMDRVNASLHAAKAQVRAAEAALNRANKQLNYTVIKAPYSGVVVERHIEVGEVANVGQLIMSGISLANLRVNTSIPQTQLAAIKTYSQAEIILNSLPSGERYRAEKFTITPKANSQSHSFNVRIDLPAQTENLYPGMFVKVAFIVGQTQRLMVPVQAVAYRGEVRAVYIVDESGKISMRQVRLGKKHADQIEILAGLSNGERLALNPLDAAIALKTQRAQLQTTQGAQHDK